ncbi:IS21 family transposase [Hoyosella sp. YIM 151337]|uniref:IS21 family transposase n=1 Tax=Hoyosella sp. YIM 151337 TaxID=2992742 RepID=UPI002236724C|nr:IS21 family transposase [Hoyosella sp. YIM 151337]MCW4354617.1 IS21 family transposase [Hoyosella sp. YIM 151337]
MLSVEDWAEIRRLHRGEGVPIKAIARMMGCSKNTVKSALRSDGPPRYQRPRRGSAVDVVEPRIRELLAAWPSMPATVIAERIGWQRSIRVLQDRVRELRPLYLPPDPCTRTAYEPGELAQCDFWFPDVRMPVAYGQFRTAQELPVLVMVSGYARWLSARLLPSREATDLFAGWWSLFEELGGVPKTLVWDGEGAVGRWRRGKPELTAECQGFRGTLGAKVLVCRPADPEAKGLVERANQYLETSFLPGRCFTGPDDFNRQLAHWLVKANVRRMRVLGCRPADRIEADRAAMLTLPPVPPVTGIRRSQRLPRDYYVRVDSNDYSVHPAVVGRRIEIVATLEWVDVFSEGRVVARHRRCWAKHQSITDPEHAEAAVALRRARLSVIGQVSPPVPVGEVEQRPLSDYDTVFGLGEDVI